MLYSRIESNRYAHHAAHPSPSPLATWLKATLQHLLAKPPARPLPRDPVREAAEVRALAESVRHSDPGFASDLFAAADRHERLGL